MKHKLAFNIILLLALCVTLGRTALASTTWYVNGANGNDSNNCMATLTPCRTIGHAISLAASGDSIKVAAATYKENLTIGISLKVVGSGATTTIIDGGGVGGVVTIFPTNAQVTLSSITIRNGLATSGGGIYNRGTLTINNSTVSGNLAFAMQQSFGGGILNTGQVTINKSTISGNGAGCGRIPCDGSGGGIVNTGQVTINNSTLSGNTAYAHWAYSRGGGIANAGTLTINNSTLSGNNATGFAYRQGGGIDNTGMLTINNSTLGGNSAAHGGGIYGGAILRNSIIANNAGGNCSGGVTSRGYNMSSDGTCNFSNSGDRNNTDPKLGPLQNNGGPTQTMALPSGSPAVDAGNPSGCTDGLGNLLKTDQRGMPRHDTEDAGGCDVGAYERQSD